MTILGVDETLDDIHVELHSLRGGSLELLSFSSREDLRLMKHLKSASSSQLAVAWKSGERTGSEVFARSFGATCATVARSV